MNKLYTLTISLILILKLATAQVPQGFKYQTAIRDNNGAVLANKLVSIKLSLLTGSASGTVIYSEVHKVATNDFGVANLNVGNGTANLGNFNTMDWGSNTFFLKTEVDINNGTNFTFMGSSQLLSVPFAMYAAKSANAADDRDKDSLNEIQNISLNNNSLQLNKNGGSVDLTKYDKDSQQLVLNGNTLSITKGNSIVLTSAVDLDADPTNEIQNLSLSKDTLKITKANFIILPKDNDADSTNEIQSLLYRNDTLQISKSNQVIFLKDNDRDSINELQGIQQSGNTVSLSKNGGNIKVPSLSNIQNGSILYANASGTNNFLLTLPDSINSYATGMTVNFKVPNSNTGHVTVNINNLGIKPLFKNVSDTMENDDLLQNKMLNIIYDGQKFQLLNQLQNNYPKFDFAHFVFDTIAGKGYDFNSPFFNNPNTWQPVVKFNKTKIIEGNSINRSFDTIRLKKGIYKIDLSYSVSSYGGYFRLRLKNLTNNTFPLIGNASTLSQAGGSITYWIGMNGYVSVINDSDFLLELFANTYSNTPIFSSNPNQPYNEVQNSLIIEKIR